MNPIYLDYNATTPVDPAVVEAMLPYLKEHWGNPSSAHAYGKAAHAAVEACRALRRRPLTVAPLQERFKTLRAGEPLKVRAGSGR